MSYESESIKPGRRPITIIEERLDKCANTYGVGPCTASKAAGEECRNTYGNCQDKANYVKTTKSYYFCENRADLPSSPVMYPCLKDDGISTAPTSTTGGKGLGNRATLTYTLVDFKHNDHGIDPYVETRLYDAIDQGTFMGRFLATNKYYEGRSVIKHVGFLTDPFDWANFKSEEYVLHKKDGPNKGEVRVSAKDILSKTYAAKTLWPKPSTGVLAADISASAGTATLSPSGIGDSEYPADGTASIGGEAIDFTRAGDALTLSNWGGWGSEIKDHKLGDTVQVMKTYNEDNVVDSLDEMIKEGTDIPDSWVPYDDGATGTPENWDNEKNNWLLTANITGAIFKPSEVDKIINEWSELFLFDIWADLAESSIYIKALAPEELNAQVNTLRDELELISVHKKDDVERRITDVLVSYDKIDYSKSDDQENFNRHVLGSNPELSGANKFGVPSYKKLLSRWFVSDTQASVLATKLYARFGETPQIITYEIDVKDADKQHLGERVILDTEAIQDETGANNVTKWQVISMVPNKRGDRITVTALTSYYFFKYWYFADVGASDYPDATSEEQEKWGHFSDENGEYSNGDPGHLQI